MRVARVEPAIRAGRSCLGGGARADPFRVLLDGGPPGRHTAPTWTRTGTACSESVSQLVREHDAVRERTPEITFLTFGSPDIAPRAIHPG